MCAQEDLLDVLSKPELDALQVHAHCKSATKASSIALPPQVRVLNVHAGYCQVRGVWVLARTGTESHDKFRKTLSQPRPPLAVITPCNVLVSQFLVEWILVEWIHGLGQFCPSGSLSSGIGIRSPVKM